jgi:hypothetical protein
MSVYSLGIPFRITCSGEAASQFYNPLQEGVYSVTRVTLDGEYPANVAQFSFIENNQTNQFFNNSSFFHPLKQVFVC